MYQILAGQCRIRLLGLDPIPKEVDAVLKIAIISDTHFGDPECALIDHEEPFDKNGNPRLGLKYRAFKEKADENNDYLVLLGDIFDFSLAKYAEAYEVAKAFFVQIKNDNIAKNIIYVPGNHDFDMWHTVEHQIRIIYEVRKGLPPKRFRWSAPGVIEDRKGKTKGFRLPGIIDYVVDPNNMREKEKMYLNNITYDKKRPGKETNFYFAYPNLYFVTDTGSILLTHGHYLEAYWSLLGEWAIKVGKKDLKIGPELDVKELVALNFPPCQLACSGIGQAGSLTEVARKVQREVKDQNLDKIPKYLKNLDEEIDKATPYGFLDPREWAIDLGTRIARWCVLKRLKRYRHTRVSDTFIDSRDKPDKEVLDSFRTFYKASWVEVLELNREHGLDIPRPQKIIFGHTHRPIGWEEKFPPQPTVACSPITLYNTGGWLWRKTKYGDREFCGAAVFTYNSNDGFKSHVIS